MGYVYKHYKSRTNLLKQKGYQKYKLINMSISLESNAKVHPTYVVTLNAKSDDLSSLQFATFNSQTPLNEFLKDNPSGMFSQDSYNFWFTPLAKEEYDVREFKVGNLDYAILRIHSTGLVYNLLLGKQLATTPYMFNKTTLKTKQDKYNLFDLINLGLLGRVTHVKLSTKQLMQDNNINDNLSTNVITYENGNSKEELDNFSLAIFNESISPLYVTNLFNYDVSLEPSQTTLGEILATEDLEYADPDRAMLMNDITLATKHETLTIQINLIS